MLRTVAKKVAWVGRTASMVFGLALVMALVFGAASVALAGNLDPLKIGSIKNVATKTTQLVGKVATGSAFAVNNPSGGSALGLQVNAGQAPLTVNAEAGKATNLDADEIDGKDASAFGIKTETKMSRLEACGNRFAWNECAKVEVTVPAGKTYNVSVWSSFTAHHPDTTQNVHFCSAQRSPGQTLPECLMPSSDVIRPSGETVVTVEAGHYTAASTFGESLPLSEGTYTFSTAIRPTVQGFRPDGDAKAFTKVMVWDATNGL